MNSLELRKLLLGSTLLVGSAYWAATPSFAQEASDETDIIETITEEVEDSDDSVGGDVIVTGSRIKRDTFSSISPLQVIKTETSIQSGLLDSATILQQDESAAGLQIDATFQGFVLDNGPGSQTIDLRGLGAARTLVTLNGRRVGPSGVEGAPVSASVNQIPASLTERTDLLLDGASSVYGSDAVAGVVNVVMRKDFDGFEAFAQGDLTEQGNNSNYTVSGSWGKAWDRGSFGIGLDYDFRDEVTFADRDFLAGCDKHVEITEDGEIRNVSIRNDTLFQEYYNGFRASPTDTTECRNGGVTRSLFQFGGPSGVVYASPNGVDDTNIGLIGYVDQNLGPVPVDSDGDGVQDFGFRDFGRGGNVLDTSFISEQKRASLWTYGEYTFEGEANITPFFEVLYTDTQITSDSGAPQLFPTVGAQNPFNPCGAFAAQDCGAAVAGVATDPDFVERWNIYQRDRDPNRDGDTRDARICATFAGGLFDNAACTPSLFGLGFASGPLDVQPIVSVEGDRDNVQVDIGNLHAVGGFKGDIPFLNGFKTLNNFSFETSLTLSRSSGTSVRRGIRGDRLNLALGNDIVTGAPLGLAPCEVQPGTQLSSDVTAGCVPVNLFATSLTDTIVGTFASQAETDFLFDTREFKTVYEQTIWNGFITGNLIEAPAGDIAVVLGAELRVDDLESLPNAVAADGLFFGFSSDLGTIGKKTTKELFGELDIPLVADKPFFRELDMNLSGRITDDELYGTNYTYSLKGGWRPVDSLLLRGSFGTSFRAPNLRENFLGGQTGFNTFFDPCVVPPDAFSNLNGETVFDPSLDTRDPDLLARCVREGVDPLTLGGGNNNGVNGAEISSAGSLDLEPERSNALTLGFSFEQPFTDWMDLTLGMSYYRIEVNQSVINPTGQFLINDCFAADRPVSERGLSCPRISRDDDGFIDFLAGGFLNRDTELVRGVDYNLSASKEFSAFDQPMELTITSRANNLLNRSTIDLDDNGNPDLQSFAGEFSFPRWTGRVSANLDIDSKWDLFWQTRWIGSVAQDEEFLDDFSNAFGIDSRDAAGDPGSDGFADFIGDTCGGPVVGDVNCRDVGFADDYFVHTASVGYTADTWTIRAGVSNVFNTSPPEVDGDEVFSISNTPIGNGYDLNGRRFFASVRKSF